MTRYPAILNYGLTRVGLKNGKMMNNRTKKKYRGGEQVAGATGTAVNLVVGQGRR